MSDIKIDSNIEQFARALGAKKGAINRAISRGVRAGGKVLYDEDRKQVNKIYGTASNPIPRRLKSGKFSLKRGSSGKKLWKRSGQLRRGERFEMPDRFTAQVVSNDTPYMARRHGLGVTWQPKRPAGGIVRAFPWRTVTKETAGPAALATAEATIKDEIAKS